MEKKLCCFLALPSGRRGHKSAVGAVSTAAIFAPPPSCSAGQPFCPPWRHVPLLVLAMLWHAATSCCSHLASAFCTGTAVTISNASKFRITFSNSSGWCAGSAPTVSAQDSAGGLARGLSVSNCGGPPHTPSFSERQLPPTAGRVTGAPPRTTVARHVRERMQEEEKPSCLQGGSSGSFCSSSSCLRGAWSSAASTKARLPTGLPSRTRPCRSAGRSTQLGLAECGCKPGSHQTGYTNGGWRLLFRRRTSARQHATGTPGHAH